MDSFRKENSRSLMDHVQMPLTKRLALRIELRCRNRGVPEEELEGLVNLILAQVNAGADADYVKDYN